MLQKQYYRAVLERNRSFLYKVRFNTRFALILVSGLQGSQLAKTFKHCYAIKKSKVLMLSIDYFHSGM